MSTQSKTTKAAPKTAATAAAAASDTVEQAVEQAVEVAKEQVEKASVAATQGYGDFAALQKEAFDALVRSSEILARGAEALGKEYFAFAKDSATANSEAAKALLTARSLQEVVDLQSKMVRTNFDKSVDESGKLSEMSLKIASEAFEPLQKQISVAVEAAIKPLSA
jgi:phasin family protein